MSDKTRDRVDNVAEIAEAMRCAAFRKADELGEDNVLLCMVEAMDMLHGALKKFVILRMILGNEKMVELNKAIERMELEKVVNEAEDALKGGRDGE